MTTESKSFAPRIVVLKWDRFVGELMRREILALWPKASVEVFQRGWDALLKIQKSPPDLLIAGARLVDMDGLEHLEAFVTDKLPILVVLSKRDYRTMSLLRTVRYDGLYDAPSEGTDNFHRALKAVIERQPYISPVCIPFLKAPRNITLDSLTLTEEKVLSIIGDGTSNEAAAERLGVSKTTIISHRRSIMRKQKFHRTPDLMRFAMQMGFVRLTPEDTFRPGFQRMLNGGSSEPPQKE